MTQRRPWIRFAVGRLSNSGARANRTSGLPGVMEGQQAGKRRLSLGDGCRNRLRGLWWLRPESDDDQQLIGHVAEIALGHASSPNGALAGCREGHPGGAHAPEAATPPA
jgi:hypothetical protein